jgi:hypothetical protein
MCLAGWQNLSLTRTKEERQFGKLLIERIAILFLLGINEK